ncbi:MAG: hypothetical protein ACLPTF_18955 [Steroidobacteraceae bacterium]
MGVCIYTRREFETATREHILQNFLGARRDSPEIACSEIQQLFATTIDKALEIGFQEYRLLLGSEGGRGGLPRPLKVETTTGKSALLQPGGFAKLAEPKVVPNPRNPEEFQIAISSIADVGWAAAKIREHFPSIDMDALIAALSEKAANPPPQPSQQDDRLLLKPQIGGEDFFRGILKSLFNLLGVNDAALALDPMFDPVRAFILTGVGGSRTFGRWPVRAPLALPKLGEFDQFIAVYSRGTAVEGVAQFFGAFHWVFRLASSYSGPDFCFAYSVDPLRQAKPAEDREPVVTSQSFAPFDEGRAEHDDDTWRYGQEQAVTFLQRHLRRAQQLALRDEVARLIRDTLGPPDGRVLTPADIARVSEAARSLAMKRLAPPDR